MNETWYDEETGFYVSSKQTHYYLAGPAFALVPKHGYKQSKYSDVIDRFLTKMGDSNEDSLLR